MNSTTEVQRGVPPLFLAARDLPAGDPYTVREICAAAEKVGGYHTVLGAQKIGGHWRVYMLGSEARLNVLTRGVEIRGHLITPFDKNPNIVTTESGDKEIPTTKVIVGGVPISFSNEEIEKRLCHLGCKLRSKLMMEKDRDENGGLTRWLTGRRFAYIEVPPKPLPQRVIIGSWSATIFHREQKALSKIPTCGRCLREGHRAATCVAEIVCRTCHLSGHKQGDPVCSLLPPKDPQDTTTTTMLSPASTPVKAAADLVQDSSYFATPATPTSKTTAGRDSSLQSFLTKARYASRADSTPRQRSRSLSAKRQARSPAESEDSNKAARMRPSLSPTHQGRESSQIQSASASEETQMEPPT